MIKEIDIVTSTRPIKIEKVPVLGHEVLEDREYNQLVALYVANYYPMAGVFHKSPITGKVETRLVRLVDKGLV